MVGKTKDPWIVQATEHYAKRCGHYCTFSQEIVTESRHTAADDIRSDETNRLLLKLNKATAAYTILLDERGKQVTSAGFAQMISKQQNAGQSTFRFLLGGAYGVEESLRSRADMVLALSEMTFPHQLVRAIFLEQLYRAFTILRGEGYHH
jgi:23S rRNA (pseudouridine1915-N3)-methyltransferase